MFCPAAVAQVQTGPIDEPRGHGEPEQAVAKGAAAISQHQDKCSTRLVVDADALFRPHRWTLNPDAAQTLDILGRQVRDVGKHPARVIAITSVAGSDAEDRDVDQRRALTVRTWLVNHHFLPEATPAERSDPGVGVRKQKKNGIVEVIFDTCHAQTE